MMKGRNIFVLLIALTFYTHETLAVCSCTGVCTGLSPYDRQACIDDGVVGDSNLCNNYCECGSNGAANLLSCPNFLGFDPITKSCTWQNDVENCGNGTTTAEIPECDATACTAPEVYNPLLGTCVPEGTYPCGEAIPKCATGSIYDNKYVTDKTNCSGYYYCKGSLRLKGSCNATLYYFNPITQQCVYKDSLECAVPGTESGSSSTGIDWANICSGIVNTFIPDPRVCNAYIYCNGSSVPRQAFCPTGKYFSNGVCVSTPPASCTCEIYQWTATTPEDVAYYGSSSDPSKFYICTKGERVEEECFPETIWSQEYESCVYH